MKLYDANTETTYTLPELKADYLIFRAEDPVNHSETFASELFDIMDATERGRNDCEIIGMTRREYYKFMCRLAYMIRDDDGGRPAQG